MGMMSVHREQGKGNLINTIKDVNSVISVIELVLSFPTTEDELAKTLNTPVTITNELNMYCRW